jgi:HPt (histidine-containing phosphotransfer) domain-containing protein
MLDATLLEELREALGEDKLRRLLEGFLAGITTLKRELPTLERSVLRARAHYLCGSAGALGLTALSDLGREVDVAIRSDRDATEPTARLARLLGHTIRAVEAYLPRLASAA